MFVVVHVVGGLVSLTLQELFFIDDDGFFLHLLVLGPTFTLRSLLNTLFHDHIFSVSWSRAV